MLTYAEPSTQAASPIARSLDFSQETRTSNVLDLINLTPLMELTSGRPEIIIGLVDGPVVIGHPDLAGENVRDIPGRIGGARVQASSLTCMHGTFVAGILCAKRSSVAPAICPGCTLLVRPIFSETQMAEELIPSATPEELAAAIIECINAGLANKVAKQPTPRVWTLAKARYLIRSPQAIARFVIKTTRHACKDVLGTLRERFGLNPSANSQGTL